MLFGGKTLAAALVASLAIASLAACGGGEDSSSTTVEAKQTQEGKPNGGSQQQGKRGSKSASGNGDGKSQPGSGGKASDFVPKQHEDSGGGAQQFRVKGGDNSVQEYGEEADSSEREAAATVLHNFLDARAEGNWAAACTYMAKSLVESFEQLASRSNQAHDESCGAILGKLTNPAARPAMKEEAEKADVGSLRVEDQRAFVIYSGIEGTVFAMPMENEDGNWKVGNLAGAPLN